MTKKIKFGSKPAQRLSADQWVNDSLTKEMSKRLTIDVTPDLHKRIKVQCASQEKKMADVIRECLEKQFPAI